MGHLSIRVAGALLATPSFRYTKWCGFIARQEANNYIVAHLEQIHWFFMMHRWQCIPKILIRHGREARAGLSGMMPGQRWVYKPTKYSPKRKIRCWKLVACTGFAATKEGVKQRSFS